MAESHHSILEERKEFMLPPFGGYPTRRMAHFLRPSVASGSGLPSPPLSSPIPDMESLKWATKISFHGWKCKEKHWTKWVETLHSSHHCVWKKAGIYEAIMSSTYQIRRNDYLVNGVAAKWCPENNTFVFPWGEATITLEDVMILGGFPVLGESVSAALEEKELVEIEEKLIQERRLLSRSSTAQKACQSIWMARFMGSGSRLEHEAFLSLWLSRFDLPIKPNSTIEKHVFSVAIKLARGIQVALAPAVLASIYRDLSLLREALVTLSKKGNCKKKVSLLAPLQFVQVWVWERFPSLRPTPKPIEIGEPRVARWHKVWGYRVENVELALDTAGATFLWRPYVRAVDNWGFHGFYREKEEWVLMGSNSDPELLAFARFLRVCKLVGVDGYMEWYFPHRVAMQFGMDQDIPGCVPECDESPAIAWRSYSKPIHGILYIPSRLFDSDVTTRYLDWWQSSIKKEANGSPNPSGLFATKAHLRQEDSNDEDRMTIEEMWRSFIGPESLGNKSAGDGKLSRSCQLQSPSSSAAKVGAMRQHLVIKFVGSAAEGRSEKAMEGEDGSNKERSALMGRSEGDMEGSEKGMKNAAAIKEKSEKITSDTIEIPGLELEARICKLERAVSRLKAARFDYRFGTKKYQGQLNH